MSETKSQTLPDPEHLLRHATFVRAVARAALRGDDLVDDVVQETWIAALENTSQRRGPLAPWLAGVVRNRARNLLRRNVARRRREHVASQPELVSPQQDVVDRLEIERRLIDAVEALPEHYRTPLVLRYLDDLPPRVIAVRLDLPVETVRTRVRRGLALLRQGLERRHGAGARHWRLALLPLVEPVRSSSPGATAVSGGLLMAKKVLIPVVAVGLLASGVAVVGHVLSPPQEEAHPLKEVSSSASRAPAARQPAAAPPVLVGRDEEARAGVDPVAARGSTEREEPFDESAVADDRRAMGAAMDALIADIRRDVAPEWWAAFPEVGGLEGHGGVVLACAPSDVIDAIKRYLDARREGHIASGEGPEERDVRAVDAARVALRPIFRGILRREQAIGAALEAWKRGRLDEARAKAEEVLSEEPDNDFAVRIRKAIGPSASKRGDADPDEGELTRLRQRLRDLRGRQTLQPWLMLWPSVTTWRAVTEALAKANLSIRGLTPDLDETLDRGHVTVDLSAAGLPEAVRRLQIESFVDIRLSWDAVKEAEQLPVVDLHEVARPLGRLLDELVGRLPAGWSWYATRQSVVITRRSGESGDPPETRVTIFNVVDILMPGSAPPEAPSRDPSAPPPVPPTYVPDPDGGPPVLVEPTSPGARSPR